MTDASYGSLSPRLLARKGGAKPAMRSQMGLMGAGALNAATADLEDLGWNDLGEDPAGSLPSSSQPASAEVIAIDSARSKVAETETDGAAAERAEEPIAPRRPNSRAPAARPAADRSAFTLRLDAERHLKLRLACTVRQCSAQQLVTDALDALLAGMPDIQKIAAQVGGN